MSQHSTKKRKLTGQTDGPSSQSHDVARATARSSMGRQREDSGPEAVGHNKSMRPSADQLLAAGAYKSPLVKLQIDELVANVQFKRAGRNQRIDELLRKLKTTIENIPSREELRVSEAEKRLKRSQGIAIPFPDPRPGPETMYKLAYAKPVSINVVGSYALGTIIKGHEPLSIDMSVTMPSSLFQEKDYLNYRYFHKRAYYLACIGAGIRDSDDSAFDIKYDYLNGNQLQPVLQLGNIRDDKNTGSSDLRCVVRVMPVALDNLFPSSKTLPSKNCVRPTKESAAQSADKLMPTPFYNASVRSECVVNSYLKLLHDASVQCQSFKEACILGRIWLRQRGLGGSIENGGFGHFEWAGLMALLLQRKGSKGPRNLSPEYSSYQLFKATLQFLATRDLTEKPLVLGTEEFDLDNTDVPVVFDDDLGVNLLFKMTPWSYKQLRWHARNSLEMMNDSVADHFDDLFIVRLDWPLDNYDFVARMPLLHIPPAILDHQSTTIRQCQKIHGVLSKGLQDRVQMIDFATRQPPAWSIESPTPRVRGDGEIKIRLVLHPANAGRTVDHGPSAENKQEATAFRKFWGDKAELRRVKDGSIQETLVWSSKSSESSITQEIVSYLLSRHLRPEVHRSTTYVVNMFGDVLPEGLVSTQKALALFQPMMTAYNEIEEGIGKLEGLPLQLRQMSSASSALRYASVVPPSNRQRVASEVADIVVQFEGSGRWPDDLEAIQRTKIALLLKAGELLTGSVQGVTTRLGLENETHATLNTAFLDIVHPNRTAFRLRIQNEKEQALNERRIKDKALSPRDREEAVLALAEYKRNFVQAASHTQSIRILCTRFPLLSQTIRLVKKWFGSHLLSLHFSEELIELLTVRTFVQPYPWQAPSSVHTGFLRTLLFLSRWDWRVEPLIVNISMELSSADVEAITTRFEAWRKIDPGMNKVVLFAASTLDLDGVTWTQTGPSKVVATRMTALARAACAAAHEAGLDLDPAVLFKSPTSDYDFLIHLNPHFFTSTTDQTASQQGNDNAQPLSEEELQLVGYRPIRLFIEELKSIYSTNILFFHDPYGGKVIAGLWHARTGSSRPWKVNLSYSTKPIVTTSTTTTITNGDPPDRDENGDSSDDDTESESDDDGSGPTRAKKEQTVQLVINKTAILNEIARLGGDMVSRIEVLKPLS